MSYIVTEGNKQSSGEADRVCVCVVVVEGGEGIKKCDSGCVATRDKCK